MHRALLAGSGVALGIDAALAVIADQSQPDTSIALDLLVALMFISAALLSAGPLLQRWLMVSVSAAWLIGSWVPIAGLVHQGVLLLALAAYPGGRLRRRDWWVAIMAVAIAAGGVQQIGVAAAFGVVAARSAAGRVDVDRADRVYPAVSAAAISMLFAVSWSTGRFSRVAFDPRLVTLGWQALLMMVAAGLIVATRRAQRRRGRLADTVLDDESVAGLEGLGQVLGEALGDRSLRVMLPPDAAAVAGRGQLFVGDGGRALAVVDHRPNLLDDPALSDGVSQAVRLAMTHEALRNEEAQRLLELERSRLRCWPPPIGPGP